MANREPSILLMRGNSITFGGTYDSDWKIVNQEGILKFISGSINYETSSSLMIDDISGNVSIGYNSYTNELYNYKININGDINLTGDLYKNGNLFNSSLNASNIDNGTLSISYGGTGHTYLEPNLLLIGNGYDAILQSSNLIWDNINVRLGIGKIEPETTLDVNGIIKSTGILCSDGPLMIDSNNNVNIGYGNIFFDGINNNIGIGTTQPTNKLHVLGDARIEGNLTVNGTSTVVNTDISTTEQIIITNDGTGPALIINQTGLEPIIEVQDDGETCFKILDGGHVEIGTITKDVNLNISGNLQLSGIITGSGSGLSSLNASNISSGTLSVSHGGTGTTTLLTKSVLVGNGTNDILQPTDLVWDNSNTRLGIGKTNPISTLDVDGIITGTGSGLTSLNASNISSGTLIVGRGGIGTTTLIAGRVLIGNGTNTLLQSANLSWNSTSNTLSATNFIGSGAGLTALNATNISSGTLTVARGGIGAGTLTSGQLLIGNGTGALIQSANLNWNNTSVRLGVGKTNPDTTLDVNGIIKSTGILCSNGALIIDTNNNINIGSGNLYIKASNNFIGVGTTLPNNKLHIKGNTQIEGDLIVSGTTISTITDVTNTEKLIITNSGTGPAFVVNQTGFEPIIEIQDDGEICFNILDGGDVGIGTSTKSVNVDISGNLKLSGIITGNGSEITSLNATNISTGTLPLSRGGIGTTTLLSSSILVGNGTGVLLQPTNLIWNNTSTRLGVGKTNPISTLDVNGIITGTGSGLTSLNASNINSGTLIVGCGGIGTTTLIAGQVLIGNGTNKLLQSANLSWNSTSNTLSATNFIGSGSGLTALNASNIDSGILSVGYGGIGTTNLLTSSVLIGNGTNALIQPENLIWNNEYSFLGIGKTIPETTLDVNGIIQSSGILCSNGALMIDINNNVNIGYGNIFFDAINNNIGIGTTEPTNKLHVLGDARIQGNLTVNGTSTIVNTDISTTEQIIITNDGTGPALIINQTGTEPIIEIQDDGETCFKILDGGHIGIGTDIKNVNVDIFGNLQLSGTITGTGSEITSLNASNISTGTLPVSHGGTGTTTLLSRSVLVGNGTNDLLQPTDLVWNNTSTRLGVGKTNPTTTLDVDGIITGIGSGLTSLNASNINSGTLSVGYGGIGTTSLLTSSILIGNGTNALIQPSNLIWNNEYSYLGIGKTDPITTLDVNGTISGIGSGLTSLNASNIDSGTLSVGYGGTGTTSLLTSSVLIGNGTNALIQPENLIWDNTNSFLGVGKTIPETTLDVNGIIQSSGILCSNGALMIDINNNVNISYGNIFVDAINNNIGIGTTEPSNKLHVLGDTRIQGNLTVNGTSTIVNTDISTSEQIIITNDGTGPALIINQTGDEPIIEVQDDGETCFKIFDGGHIGIGTDTKNVNVDISGNLQLSGIITGTGSEITSLNASKISTGTLPVSYGGTGATTLLTKSVLVGNGTGTLIQPANLVWDNTNTRLGVGKTNPNSTLDVNGIITGTGSGLTSLNASNMSSGTLTVARGGIGTTTLITGRVLIGNGTGTLIQSANLSWNSTSNTLSSTNFIGSGAGLTALNATNISSGTLTVARGGIGATTLSTGQLLIGNGTGTLIQSANLSWNNVSTRLGIGVTIPQRTAHILSSLRIGGSGATLDFGDDLNNQIYKNSTNNDILIKTNGTNQIIINSLGNVGIGTTTPALKLHVIGDIGATGTVTASYSDERLKTITSKINNPLKIINNLNGFYYIPNELANTYGINSKNIEIGLNAQEIQKELPEIVKLAPFDIEIKDGEIISKSGQNYLTVSYERLIPVIIEAIKDLSKEINDIKKIINN
jgi:hypothetical protein